MTDRIDELEKTVDQLVRRARAHDEFMAYLDSRQIEPSVRDKRNAILADYGVKPFREPPATTGLRFGAEIVERDDGGLDVMHGDRYLGWTGSPRVYRWQTPFYPEDDLTGNFDTRDAALSALASAPPPPGWVEPKAAPAPEKGEGDGKPEDAPADRTRLTLYPAKMCDSTRAAFDWISRHDGGAHGALFTRTLSDACAEYAASATAALARERDSLREELARVKAENERVKKSPHVLNGSAGYWHVTSGCARFVGDAEAVKAENERLKGTPQPQRWFVGSGYDHRSGTHGCYRFNSDGSGGRWWYRGKDHKPSRYTLAYCIIAKDLTEISPTTGEPIGKKRAKVKAKAATRKKARGK